MDQKMDNSNSLPTPPPTEKNDNNLHWRVPHIKKCLRTTSHPPKPKKKKKKKTENCLHYTWGKMTSSKVLVLKRSTYCEKCLRITSRMWQSRTWNILNSSGMTYLWNIGLGNNGESWPGTNAWRSEKKEVIFFLDSLEEIGKLWKRWTLYSGLLQLTDFLGMIICNGFWVFLLLPMEENPRTILAPLFSVWCINYHQL